MTIVITAFLTLIGSILAGLALDYLRRVRRRIDYFVKDAVPIKLEDKTIGAYVVAFANQSKQTIKDVSCHVRATPATLRNGGAHASQGLQHQIAESEEGIQIFVPYLASGDHLELTVIAESGVFVPREPDVAIRTPQQVSLVYADKGFNRTRLRGTLLLTATAAAFVAGVSAWSITMGSGMLVGPQRETLTFAASRAGLPHLAEIYATGDKIWYSPQGDLAVVLAAAGDSAKREQYRMFLRLTLSEARMTPPSRAKLFYALAEIDLLLGDRLAARNDLRESSRLNSKLVRTRSGQDDAIRQLLGEVGSP